MSKRTTIADVAEKAGVSMMTVSRAINNKDGVSTATRERIVQIANEMGFQPNSIARGLATQRTATVGLVVPDISNPFFAETALGVEDVAYDNNYNVFLLNSSEILEREQKALDSLLSKQVDGLIWCSSRLPQPQLLRYLQQFSYTVLINRDLDEPLPNVVTIGVDDESAAAQAVTHFCQDGRQNLAFVSGPTYSLSGQKRLKGFLKACSEHSVVVADGVTPHCSPDSQSGYLATRKLLSNHPAVDAILAYNDLVAVGVMQACKEFGRQVPEQIAIIGIDDIPLAKLVTPSLSTLRIDKHQLGVQAMETVLRLIRSEATTGPSQLLQPQLIYRQSAPANSQV